MRRLSALMMGLIILAAHAAPSTAAPIPFPKKVEMRPTEVRIYLLTKDYERYVGEADLALYRADRVIWSARVKAGAAEPVVLTVNAMVGETLKVIAKRESDGARAQESAEVFTNVLDEKMNQCLFTSVPFDK